MYMYIGIGNTSAIYSHEADLAATIDGSSGDLPNTVYIFMQGLHSVPPNVQGGNRTMTLLTQPLT